MRTKQSVKVQVTVDERKTTVLTDRGMKFEMTANDYCLDGNNVVATFVASLISATVSNVLGRSVSESFEFIFTAIDNGKED